MTIKGVFPFRIPRFCHCHRIGDDEIARNPKFHGNRPRGGSSTAWIPPVLPGKSGSEIDPIWIFTRLAAQPATSQGRGDLADARLCRVRQGPIGGAASTQGTRENIFFGRRNVLHNPDLSPRIGSLDSQEPDIPNLFFYDLQMSHTQRGHWLRGSHDMALSFSCAAQSTCLFPRISCGSRRLPLKPPMSLVQLLKRYNSFAGTNPTSFMGRAVRLIRRFR